MTVMAVNDAHPVMSTSSVVRVPQGGSAIITSNNLQATDEDTSDEQVLPVCCFFLSLSIVFDLRA